MQAHLTISPEIVPSVVEHILQLIRYSFDHHSHLLHLLQQRQCCCPSVIKAQEVTVTCLQPLLRQISC